MNATAQNAYSAYLSSPPGGQARLDSGRFWFRVDNGEVQFQAVIFKMFPQQPTSLDPVLSVPGSSLNFVLGEGVATEFRGLYWDRNPFIPINLPIQFDEEGNPFLIDAPVIRYGDLYTGRFTLPSGFEAKLLAGGGSVRFNDFLAGSIVLAPVPEPSTFALLGLSALVAAVILRRRR